MVPARLQLLLFCALALAGCGAKPDAPAAAALPARDPSTKRATPAPKPTPEPAVAKPATYDTKKDIVGLWNVNTDYPSSYEFKGDGSLQIIFTLPTKDAKGMYKMAIDETYTVKGDDVSTKPQNVEVTTDEESQKQEAEKQTKLLNSNIAKAAPASLHVKWIDTSDIEITLAPAEGSNDKPTVISLRRHEG